MKSMAEIENALEKSEKILKMFAKLCVENYTPKSKQAQMLVRNLILHIEENFFICNKENLQNLINEYNTNPEQIKILNEKCEGLNTYIVDAIKFYMENN